MTVPTGRTVKRCPWAIKFGVTLTTRCYRPTGHATSHEGRGLAQFDYQLIRWFPGDRREFRTDRDDDYAWEDGLVTAIVTAALVALVAACAVGLNRDRRRDRDLRTERRLERMRWRGGRSEW